MREQACVGDFQIKNLLKKQTLQSLFLTKAQTQNQKLSICNIHF